MLSQSLEEERDRLRLCDVQDIERDRHIVAVFLIIFLYLYALQLRPWFKVLNHIGDRPLNAQGRDARNVLEQHRRHIASYLRMKGPLVVLCKDQIHDRGFDGIEIV